MERLFNLDPQLIHDAVLLMISVLVMFTFLSYLLFNPAREFLKKRQDKIRDDIDSAKKDKEEAAALKADYDGKIREIEKEAEAILSEARQKALKNEAKIIDEARKEASGIIERANRQAELEKKAAADDMKKEIIKVAALMAQKIVNRTVDAQLQDNLVEETLKEIGEETWLS